MGLRVNAAARRRLGAIQSQLQTARLDAGLSQEALGDLLDVSSRTLRDWEHGRESPSLTNLLLWARVFGFRVEVADRTVEPEPAAVAAWDDDHWNFREMERLAMPLRARRLARQISQTDLGLIVGVSRSSLQRWEDAEQLPRPIALIVWAGRLDLSVELHRFDDVGTR